MSETVFITNAPAPYREPVNKRIFDKLNGKFTVIYCTEIEPDRLWKFDLEGYKKIFLKIFTIKIGTRNFYLNSNIFNTLNKIKPEIVVIGGLSHPMLVGYLWAKINKKKIIALSDATIESEKDLSFIHKIIRILIYPRVDCFLGVSRKTSKLFKSYSNKKEFFQTMLCANNNEFGRYFIKPNEREFDVILCGQMIPRKMYDFSINVLKEVHKKNNIKITILGDGVLKNEILNKIKKSGLNYNFVGHVEPSQIYPHYANSKLLLFPTRKDCWGLVANEACAAGTPVITSPQAGVAGELIIDKLNGRILELDKQIWKNAVEEILQNDRLLNSMSQNSIDSVKNYNYEDSAKGFVKAVKYCEELSK